jgi:hypothetical protein
LTFKDETARAVYRRPIAERKGDVKLLVTRGAIFAAYLGQLHTVHRLQRGEAVLGIGKQHG